MLVKTKYSPRPDMVSWTYEYVQDAVKGAKARKVDSIDKSVVTVNNIPFDADEVSMDRMARVISSAYGAAMKSISTGVDAQTACSAALGSEVQWKCADDVIRAVSVSTLVDALDAAKDNMATKWLG